MSGFNIISEKMTELDENGIKRVIRQALRVGISPEDILDAVILGMDGVVRSFEDGEYSICDLIMAGTIFDNILEDERTGLKKSYGDHIDMRYPDGLILMGTVSGDYHDIGKNMFHSLARTVGFHVIDLGVNVSANAFYEAAKQYKPDIIALSASMNDCISGITETIGLLKNDPETESIYILLGGNYARYIPQKPSGVDGYTCSVQECVNLCIHVKNRNTESICTEG